MSAWYVYTLYLSAVPWRYGGGCGVYIMYRRGLTALLILVDGQCESLMREQVEEEATAQGILEKIRKADKAALLFIDDKLGQRV